MARFIVAVSRMILLLAAIFFERSSVLSGFFPSSCCPLTARSSSRQQQDDEIDADNKVTEFSIIDISSRRGVIRKTVAVAAISLLYTTTIAANPASAASTIKPEDAYQGLLKAREELITAAKTYLPNRDFDGMRTFLAEQAVNINNYESNAQALLTSKRLDNESKKEIGTIRRYGVGADVIIMYGGLRSELDDNEYPNGSQVSKYLTRSLDSLQEVIVICQNNGFF